MSALTLFDSQAASDAAEQGMEQARRAERVQTWKQEADTWLFSLVTWKRVGEITADDLVAAVGLPDTGPARNNVVGAWFSAKAKAGRLEWTGRFRKSERVVGHGNLQRVWRVVA